jgi:hypothetical protein
MSMYALKSLTWLRIAPHTRRVCVERDWNDRSRRSSSFTLCPYFCTLPTLSEYNFYNKSRIGQVGEPGLCNGACDTPGTHRQRNARQADDRRGSGVVSVETDKRTYGHTRLHHERELWGGHKFLAEERKISFVNFFDISFTTSSSQQPMLSTYPFYVNCVPIPPKFLCCHVSSAEGEENGSIQPYSTRKAMVWGHIQEA